MASARSRSLFSSLLFAAAAWSWTAAGESADPRLSARELPPEILNACGTGGCVDDVDYRARWVGRTPAGNLFVVGRTSCIAGRCTHWLVEKGATPVRVLLELDGAFALYRLAGRYPAVEVRRHASDQGLSYLRFEWTGEQYVRTSARRVYEVGGVECGTREECAAAAERALTTQRVDRALRIWQQVYGVSWI